MSRPSFTVSGAHTTHPGVGHAVYSRNGARADMAVLDQPTRHLAHWAHYVDAYRRIGSNQVGFAAENYLAAADVVGAWG